MDFGNAVADGRPRVRHYVMMPSILPAAQDGTRGALCTVGQEDEKRRKKVRDVAESPLPLCKGCERERAEMDGRAERVRNRPSLDVGPSNRIAPLEGEQPALLI